MYNKFKEKEAIYDLREFINVIFRNNQSRGRNSVYNNGPKNSPNIMNESIQYHNNYNYHGKTGFSLLSNTLENLPTSKKQSLMPFIVLNIVYAIGILGNISALIILVHKDKVRYIFLKIIFQQNPNVLAMSY